MYAALLDTRLPRLHLVPGEAGATEVVVDEDPAATVPFPGAEGVPVCVTFLQVGGAGRGTWCGRAWGNTSPARPSAQVGEHSLVDSRWQEEACADARIRVAVDR